MTPMAHRRASSPVCPTCQRRDRLVALVVIILFVLVFALRLLVPA